MTDVLSDGHRAATERFFAAAFADRPVMAIFRGQSPEATADQARRAWGLGIQLVEVPVSSPDGWTAFEAVLEAAEGRPVGVGTVVTPDQVERAALAGASFIVSPGFDPLVSMAAQQAGLFHLPGVATASEVGQALLTGLTWLKAFPASVLGPSWIQAMLGPFPQASFVCTGGMSLQSWPEFQEAGARAVAIGRGFA